MKQVYIS